MVHIEKSSGPFGAYVTGVDLSAPLSAADLATVRAAWLENYVLAFPDQPLTHEALEGFTAQFGPFGEDPFIEPLADHPHILELRREPTETVSNFGAAWHSDWSFQASPPAATILHSKVTPPVGGDTLFADGYAAWADLPDSLKQKLLGLRGIHSAILPYSPRGVYAQDQDQRSMKFKLSEEAEDIYLHPIARVHPETGRVALFINRVYTIGIDGLPHDEAMSLLDELCAHSIQDKYVYRHKWQPNMLLMWDNRCLQHLADGGYDGHLRVMHRTTVGGDAPIASDHL
jgi:taurine dioxygenase